MATSPVGSFVIFLYADGRIQWTAGDNSGGSEGLGGTEALAGYSASNGMSYTVPGSHLPSIINIARTSNVGIPGTYIFQVGGIVFAHELHLTEFFTIIFTELDPCNLESSTCISEVCLVICSVVLLDRWLSSKTVYSAYFKLWPNVEKPNQITHQVKSN